MKEAEHCPDKVLIRHHVTLRPRYDRLNNQLLKILCKQIRVTSVLIAVIRSKRMEMGFFCIFNWTAVDKAHGLYRGAFIATQLNSTRRQVELSCELSRFGHPLRRTTPIADGR